MATTLLREGQTAPHRGRLMPSILQQYREIFVTDTIPTALASLNGAGGVRAGDLVQVSALNAPLPDSEVTGIVRVDVFETDWSDYGRACQMMRLSALSQTLRNWAREAQRASRQAAGVPS